MSGAVGRRAIVLLAVTVVALTIGGAGGFLAAASTSSSPGSIGVAASGACPGSGSAHAYNGTVAIQNSTFIPVTPINYSYDAEVASSINGGAPYAYACEVENGTTHAAPSGDYNFTILAAPSVVCGPQVGGVQFCNSTSGPYGPVTLAPAPPYPTGLEPVVTENGTSFHIEFYRDLANVSLAPVSTIAPVSVGEVATFDATPWSVLGTPSPVAPAYSWTVAGTGWQFAESPDGGAVANVTATPGAGPGNLSVVASLATASGWAITAPATVPLVALATSIANVTVDRAAVDEGQSLAFFVNGSGAPGLAYRATLDPGLGSANVTVPCPAANVTEGPTVVGCSIAYVYASNGTASPSVTLSNGDSAATAPVANVSVAPAPVVAFVPGDPRGYVEEAVPIEVAAAAGTGTAPFREACFADGDGPSVCSYGAGPTWSFDPTYATPGNYPISAWVVDALGSNRSVAAEVTIANPLSLDLPAPGTPPAGGAATSLTATLEGGLLPARAYWNATSLLAPFAESIVTADGPLNSTFVPAAAGPVTVSLTIVDAAGSRTVATLNLTVLAGPATAIVADSLAGPPTAVAGSPILLEWQARDPAGATVPLYASAAEISITNASSGADLPGWVNASGAGALASPLVGWYDVPAHLWANGTLAVAVDLPMSGAVEVNLAVADGGPAAPAPVDLTVVPDDAQLRLFDPAVAASGPRAGSTLWRVSDRFGNPAPGAVLNITVTQNGRSTTTPAYADETAAGTTDVWVNYSVSGMSAATVTVRDLAGDELLPPIQLGAPTTGLAQGLLLATVLPALAIGAGLGAISWRRRVLLRASETADDDPALQRLAEGRATATEIVRTAGPLDLAGIAARWDPPPAPPELAEWVASLLTDGTFAASGGDDGNDRFAFVPEPEPEGPPHVTVDVVEFDRGLRLRDAATQDDEP